MPVSITMKMRQWVLHGWILQLFLSTFLCNSLSKAFGSSPETWLGMQMAYDLRRAKSRIDEVKVKKFKTA